MSQRSALMPSSRVQAGDGGYRAPRPRELRLKLDANEGRPPEATFLDRVARLGSEVVSRYPDASALEARLAERHGVDPSRVVVTAGGDDAIDRICRVMLEPGRKLVLPVPTFEMVSRYAALTGATVIEPAWLEPRFPRAEVSEALGQDPSLAVVISPNNPTGFVAQKTDLEDLATRHPHALVLLDAAYAEFADHDLTPHALAYDNVVVVRTFSKAWGLAGIRLGYAIGSPEVIGWMRAVAGPYNASRTAIACAELALDDLEEAMHGYVARIRNERERMVEMLSELGARPYPSQANFVLARFDDAEAVHRALLDRGIAVRRFGPRAHLEDALRITLPGDEPAWDELCQALRQATSGARRAPSRPKQELRGAAEAAESASHPRHAEQSRETKETAISAKATLEGRGESHVATGIGFLDHMVGALAKHARIDITLLARGDLEIDDHHTSEDAALTLGAALDEALGDRRGIGRFGAAYAPLDEALARAVVDLSGRPHAELALALTREAIGGWATENIPHFIASLATAMRATIHVEVLRGENDHHKVEAAFKALALALRQAVRKDGGHGIPSTKGTL